MSEITILPWIDQSKLVHSSIMFNKNPKSGPYLLGAMKKEYGNIYQDLINMIKSMMPPIKVPEPIIILEDSSLPLHKKAMESIEFIVGLEKERKHFESNPEEIIKLIDDPALYSHSANFSSSDSPKVLALLNANPDLINWLALYQNKSPQVVEIIKNHMDRIDSNICTAVHDVSAILEENKHLAESYLLSVNTNRWAIDYIRKHPRMGLADMLSRNQSPHAIQLLNDRPDFINAVHLSANHSPDAIKLLRKFPKKISWKALSGNSSPDAIELLGENVDKIHWAEFSANKCPLAATIMRQNLERLVWSELSKNPNPEAIKILIEHPNEINFWLLSSNRCPEAMDLLRAYPTRINFEVLSQNDCLAAVALLREYPTRIDWYHIFSGKFTHAMLLIDLLSSTKWVRSQIQMNKQICEIIISRRSFVLNTVPENLEYLREHPDEIDWKLLSLNAGIFE